MTKGEEAFDQGGVSCTGHAVDLGEEVEILTDGQIAVETEALRHVANMVAYSLRIAQHIDTHHRGVSAMGA